jgi:hypothetical protein
MLDVDPLHPGRQRSPGHREVYAVLLALLAGACGGDGGGVEPDPTVASVVVTTAAPTFGALGRTAQFAAEARDAAGVALTGRTFTWFSANTGVASVSTSGVVTAVANGTTQITASTGGKTSSGVTVTVSQVPHEVVATPASVTFGAVGSTRQLAAAVRDSTANTISSATVAWTRAGTGTTATVSAAGLVTSSGAGASDTAVAAAGSATARVPIAVTQVVATVTVTSAAGTTPDILYSSSRTRQFNAAAADSNGNAIAGVTFSWLSSATGVATVDAGTGLVTSVGDGTAQISAAASGISGSRSLVVRRLAKTLTVSPTSAAISTASGTQAFTGTATDSADAPLSIAWTVRPTGFASISPTSGGSTTATAVGNGTTYVVITAGFLSDSAQLTVTNQPVSFASQVQPIFTQNCALSGCHTGSGAQAGLNLSAGQAYGEIVNQSAPGFPGATYVIPGNPDDSYLIRKLENRNISGAPMPDGGPPLSSATIQVIRNWIAQGAPNN